MTVVPNEELRRTPASTLGDLLFAKPGITGSSFAPGASSRPIIRGLDVNRVGIVENGVGAGGVSDLGEDHFVPVTPLMSDQVEVIRGPATLRYGSQSIGGVVERDQQPHSGCAFAVRRAVRALRDARRARRASTTASKAACSPMRPPAMSRSTPMRSAAAGDYRMPRYPYLFDPARPFNGQQPNSCGAHRRRVDRRARTFSIRASSAPRSRRTTRSMRIPGIDGEGHRTRIDARETKVTAKGEYRPQAGGIDAVRFWYGYTDYRHNEIGLADPLDVATDGVRQTFTNKEHEGRVEVQLMPFDLRFAALTTALGVQAGQQELTAPGDAPGPLSGLFAPNDNTRVAGYIFNEFKFSGLDQGAGRRPHRARAAQRHDAGLSRRLPARRQRARSGDSARSRSRRRASASA